MREQKYFASFWPTYGQFVIYDVRMPYDPGMVPHFNAPDELASAGGVRASLRKLEVSVGLLDDREVEIELTTHGAEPGPVSGSWPVVFTCPLGVPSGRLGVGDITADRDAPVLSFDVMPGNLILRVHGFCNSASQRFAVQIWPSRS